LINRSLQFFSSLSFSPHHNLSHKKKKKKKFCRRERD